MYGRNKEGSVIPEGILAGSANGNSL